MMQPSYLDTIGAKGNDDGLDALIPPNALVRNVSVVVHVDHLEVELVIVDAIAAAAAAARREPPAIVVESKAAVEATGGTARDAADLRANCRFSSLLVSTELGQSEERKTEAAEALTLPRETRRPLHPLRDVTWAIKTFHTSATDECVARHAEDAEATLL